MENAGVGQHRSADKVDAFALLFGVIGHNSANPAVKALMNSEVIAHDGQLTKARPPIPEGHLQLCRMSVFSDTKLFLIMPLNFLSERGRTDDEICEESDVLISSLDRRSATFHEMQEAKLSFYAYNRQRVALSFLGSAKVNRLYLLRRVGVILHSL